MRRANIAMPGSRPSWRTERGTVVLLLGLGLAMAFVMVGLLVLERMVMTWGR